MKHSRERWIKIIEAWRESGKSAKAWCRENKLIYTTFLGWKNRLSRKSHLNPVNSSFIELKDRPQISSGVTLEYEGIHINISSDFDQATLNRCLQVLRGTVC